jgi:murein L,D-transpeptidase YcbB/YkuD
VRVANAQRLAEWVLQFQVETWDSARIETQITSDETRTLALDAPIAVFIVYFTSYVDAEGTLRFHQDLYEADPPIINALNASTQ